MNLRMMSTAMLVLALAACATGNGYRSSNNGYRNSNNCQACGVVQRIETYSGERRTSGGGAVAGAIIGGVLGNQVGKGDGRKAATVVGAVAGGIAGNAIERNANNWHEISVRMSDGRQLVFTQNDLHGVREGSRAVIRNDRVHLN